MELIISHTNCDFDSFASMVAASLLHPQAKICIVGSPENNLKRFLLENNTRLDLIKEKSVSPEQITKLIIVDNRDPKRMGKIGSYLMDTVNNPDKINKQKTPIKPPTIICYDHHPDSDNDIFHDYSHTQPTGACTTIMLDFLNRAGIQINTFQASLFALGIYEDTGNFLHINTTYKDFAAASHLFNIGASLEFVKRYLAKEFTSIQFAIINTMLANCDTISIKGIETTFIDLDFRSYREDIALLVQTVKKSKSLKLVFCISIRNEKIDVIARNDYDFINLDSILRNFNGGGHKTAGYASISSPASQNSKTEKVLWIKKRVIEEVEKQIVNYGTVADLMTSPADAVRPETTLNEALTMLLNNNYSTVLVADKKNMPIGILTKKDISRALHHQMSSLPVENCMSTNVVTVNENKSIYNAYKILVDYDIGRLPVIGSDGNITGIITRTDMLIHQFRHISTLPLKQADYDNVRGLMQNNIENDVVDLLKQAGHVGDTLGMNVYVVGGFVRDLILQHKNYDIDLVVEGEGIKYAQEYCNKFGKSIKTFPKFGTSFVILKDGKRIDITTARREHYPTAGSLPEVKFSGIENDLFRRDFTINSLAIQINANHFGKFFDFYGGRRDLKLSILRVLNNFSFVEDPIRILRAIRFEQRFRFRIEKKTTHLLKKSLQLLSLDNVSGERIKAELIYSSKKGPPDRFFSRLQEFGILKQLNNNLSFSTQNKTICQRIDELTIWFKNSFPKESPDFWICYHLALLHGLTLRIKEKFAFKLKYSKKFIDSLRKSDSFVRYRLPEIEKEKNEGIIAIDLHSLNLESILYSVATTDNTAVKDKFIRYLSTHRFIKPELDGNDLLKLGLPQGEFIGKILDDLRKAKINKVLHNKKAELAYVKNLLARDENK